jgi:cell wall-associated NlpC family hydrolase
VRSTVRGALATAVALACVGGFTSAAVADKHPTVPTKSQVDQAKANVTKKAGDVASIQAALVVANNRLEQAGDKAEEASEAYNGAVWHLQLAKAATTKALAAAKAATAHVATERAGIAALAVQSYSDGTSLAGVTALLGPGGPADAMNRVDVVESAASSMKARFDEYAAASALAKAATKKAEADQAKQAELTTEAAHLRDSAAAQAKTAQSQATAIAAQKSQLITQLAADQKISVALATQRQQALEAIAAAKAAAAAAAKARAAAEAAAQAAAAKKANEAKGGSSDNSAGDPGDDSPTTQVATTAAAARAIAFARRQLGKMYLWAAAGPDRWDCSGLTMVAWQQGGVSLPHYSAAQYAEIEHIGVDDLRPGDLVFWGGSPDTIHHVAMYLGGGMIIQAPHTGAAVDIESMYAWEAPSYFGRP